MMTYATSSPAATTGGGQGNNHIPVSVSSISRSILGVSSSVPAVSQQCPSSLALPAVPHLLPCTSLPFPVLVLSLIHYHIIIHIIS